MFYVYCKHVRNGAENYCGAYETMEKAIERITGLYNMDKNMESTKFQYYYFIKEH